MTETPNIWQVGEAIPFELFLMDPSTKFGVTGQVAFITLTVKRLSDNLYWNGTNWVVGLTAVPITEPDDTVEKGRYIYTLAAISNTQEDVYLFHAVINNPGLPFTGENYEQHRSQVTDVRVYEAEPSQ